MISIRSIAQSLRTRDDGVALPTVFGLGMVMLILIGSALTVATRGIVKSTNDEDFNAALAAAYAGVEEYQSRLANDSNYQKFGNPAAPYSASSASSLSLPTGANANPAFGIGTTGTWANIPDKPKSDGTAVQSPAWFRYEVNNKDYQDKGILHLRVTGRVNQTTRSIVADLKQDGFIDYLYFTNYETTDPAFSADDATAYSQCERYAYASSVPARDTGDCTVIQFGSSDVLKGPVRSNDQLLICGSTFEKGVISSSPTTPIWKNACSSNPPDFQGGAPVYGAPIGMPPTNSEMKKETRNDLAADVPRPGCLYTGPTVIKFVLVGGVTKMRVISPWTKYTNVTGSTSASATNPAGASNPAQCGTPGTADGSLGGKDGALIDPLERNLIYVQAVPAVGAADANAPAGSGMPSSRFSCLSATSYTVGGGSNKVTVSIPAGWQFAGATTTYRYPKGTSTSNTESTPYTGRYVASSYKHYDCRAGDVYIEGQMSGQMTVAADNFVYVTNDLTYRDKSTDVLGLVGNNAVFVYNPVHITSFSGSGSTTWPSNTYRQPNGYTALGTTGDREIDAAILSVAHTFQVQNYTYGDRGTLKVFGAIAQKFRGTVAYGSNGYVKLYEYDTRFRNIAPPKFLTPTSTTYGVTQIATVPAAFSANGAAN
ncbi:MAG TPA: hypothetical protein VL294_13845 [Pseudolysinimonas sp.]|jgi:hypothetical protein|nr:hypothetical protein [Pseudolysinimonas sp.]